MSSQTMLVSQDIDLYIAYRRQRPFKETLKDALLVFVFLLYYIGLLYLENPFL